MKYLLSLASALLLVVTPAASQQFSDYGLDQYYGTVSYNIMVDVLTITPAGTDNTVWLNAGRANNKRSAGCRNTEAKRVPDMIPPGIDREYIPFTTFPNLLEVLFNDNDETDNPEGNEAYIWIVDCDSNDINLQGMLCVDPVANDDEVNFMACAYMEEQAQ